MDKILYALLALSSKKISYLVLILANSTLKCKIAILHCLVQKLNFRTYFSIENPIEIIIVSCIVEVLENKIDINYYSFN